MYGKDIVMDTSSDVIIKDHMSNLLPDEILFHPLWFIESVMVSLGIFNPMIRDREFYLQVLYITLIARLMVI